MSTAHSNDARGADRPRRRPVPAHGHHLVLLALLLIAFALRLFRLADANIWWDEGWSVSLARLDLWEITRLSALDVHPPLYLWLLHGWQRLVGESEFAVRFLSAAAGTSTVAALYFLGRTIFPHTRWLPLAGALLLALSRFALWWSQEARMYTLAAFLATLSLAFAVRLRWQPTRRAALGYLASTVAALWTLYLLAFLLVIQGLYWLWSLRSAMSWPERGRLLARWTMLQLATLSLFLPWLLYALPRMRGGSAAEVPFDPTLYLQLFATLLTLGVSTNIERYGAVVGALLIALAASLLLRLRPRSRGPTTRVGGATAPHTLLLLTLFVPLAAVWSVTALPRAVGYLPKPEARYLLPFAPSFYLLLGSALGALAAQRRRVARWAVGAALVGLVLLSLWSLQGYYAGRYRADDYESVALTLRAHRQPGDGVVLHTDEPWPVFHYHWAAPFEGTPHLQSADEGGAEYFLAPLWEAHGALWLVVNEDALRVDPQRHFEGWLAARAVAQHEWRLGNARLLLFARTPIRAARLLALAPGYAPPPPPSPVEGEGWRLVGWEQPQRRARPGTLLQAAAYVARDGSPASGAVATLRVWLGKERVAVTEVAIPPGEGIVRLPIALQVPTGLGARHVAWYIGSERGSAAQSDVRLLPDTPPPAPATVSPEHLASADLGDPPVARLLGYDLGGSTQPGDTLLLTLYWEAGGPSSLSYKVFTHLLNPEGRVAAQRDDIPLQGTRPTTTWRAGEILVDRYEIPLAPDLSPGPHRLVIGLYDPTTGNRLTPIHDDARPGGKGADQLWLGVVEVR